MASTQKVLEGINERVEHGLIVERVLTRLGWLVLMLGVVALGTIALQWLWGNLTAEKALAAAGGTALATILWALACGTGIRAKRRPRFCRGSRLAAQP